LKGIFPSTHESWVFAVCPADVEGLGQMQECGTRVDHSDTVCPAKPGKPCRAAPAAQRKMRKSGERKTLFSSPDRTKATLRLV